MKRDYIKPIAELIDFKLTEAIMNTTTGDSGDFGGTDVSIGGEDVGDW